MKKLRSLLLRLRCCWRVLTRPTFCLYVPDGPDSYPMAYSNMCLSDAAAMYQWTKDRREEVLTSQQLLNDVFTANPGIAPAP